MTFGPWLRGQRQQRGMTLETAAMVLEFSPSYLSDVERGRRKPSIELQVNLELRWQIPFDLIRLRAGFVPYYPAMLAADDATLLRAWAAAKAIFSAPAPRAGADPPLG